jgi:hypothetical protein
VSAYAIDDGARLILIDPIAVPDDVRALFGSREVVTVLTSTWHERDAASLGFPVWAPAPEAFRIWKLHKRLHTYSHTGNLCT